MKRLHVIMVGGEENVNRKRAALETRSMLTLLLGKLSGNNDPYICLKDDIIIDLASHYKRSLAPKIRLLREAMLSEKSSSFSIMPKTVRRGVCLNIIGRVRHAAVEEGHSSIENICSANAFMYNVHSPKRPRTGVGDKSAVAVLQATGQ